MLRMRVCRKVLVGILQRNRLVLTGTFLAGSYFFRIWAAASDVGGYVAARVSASISGVPISIGWEVGLAHFGKLF